MPAEVKWESLVELLLPVENSIKNHYNLLQSETEVQRGLLDRMWVLVQRYTILSAGGVPCKYRSHPPDEHQQIDDELKMEFHNKHQILADSNAKLSSSLSNVKSALTVLARNLADLDMNHLTSLEQSDAIKPSIISVIEIFSDFHKFFTRSQGKLNCSTVLLSSDSLPSLERYKKLIEPNKEFADHFAKSIAYANCLCTRRKTNTCKI